MAEIQIVYKDGMFGFVEPRELTRLIAAGEVVKFLRGDTWIYLEVDLISSGALNQVVFEGRYNP